MTKYEQDLLDQQSSDFNRDVSGLANSSPEEIMSWAVSHPNFSQNYASYIDSLITQAYNKKNFDYEYSKNNDMSYFMAQLEKAGINPTLAFRSNLGSGASIGSTNSNYASDLAKKASLEETKRQHDAQSEKYLMSILSSVGVAILGAIIAMI